MLSIDIRLSTVVYFNDSREQRKRQDSELQKNIRTAQLDFTKSKSNGRIPLTFQKYWLKE